MTEHKVGKAELCREVAKRAKLTQRETAEVMDALTATIQDNLVKGKKVQLIGFGSFEVKKCAERKGRNPRTGDILPIPAHNKPFFKPGKKLRDAVN